MVIAMECLKLWRALRLDVYSGHVVTCWLVLMAMVVVVVVR